MRQTLVMEVTLAVDESYLSESKQARLCFGSLVGIAIVICLSVELHATEAVVQPVLEPPPLSEPLEGAGVGLISAEPPAASLVPSVEAPGENTTRSVDIQPSNGSTAVEMQFNSLSTNAGATNFSQPEAPSPQAVTPQAATPQAPSGRPVSIESQNVFPNPSPPPDSIPAIAEVSDSSLPQPYWIKEGQLAIKAPIHRAATIELDSLIWAALAHSPYVQSIQIRPQILETEVNQARGEFDTTRFASSIWNDRSDPVGNTLTTGGPNRLNEQVLDSKAGIRKKNEYGGNWEAAQELGLRDSNSVFFVPRKQADSRMVMRYTQPLMKGAGRTYNRASITIAELNFDSSNHETRRAVQSHVMDIIQAYWELAYQRALVLQLYRGISRIQAIETQLQNRSDLDAIRNQLLRARSSVDGLKGRYARSLAQVVQSEERLRQLVNAPWIQPALVDELIPVATPTNELLPIHLEQELDAALMSRPDILAIRDQIKAANTRLRIAENDLRPTLNLVTDLYVRGLNGQYDAANSFADQFSAGAPSYSGGLEYLRPKNQTAANAIRRSRDLEMRQLLFDLEDKLLQAGAEVRTSIASIQATHAELASSVSAAIASQSEVEYIDARWQSGVFLEPTQVSLSLEQLLDAEQRLVQSEGNWAASQSQYMISLARLRFVSGTLLSIEPAIDEDKGSTSEPTP